MSLKTHAIASRLPMTDQFCKRTDNQISIIQPTALLYTEQPDISGSLSLFSPAGDLCSIKIKNPRRLQGCSCQTELPFFQKLRISLKPLQSNLCLFLVRDLFTQHAVTDKGQIMNRVVVKNYIHFQCQNPNQEPKKKKMCPHCICLYN